jgi:hypothetical protein
LPEETTTVTKKKKNRRRKNKTSQSPEETINIINTIPKRCGHREPFHG